MADSELKVYQDVTLDLQKTGYINIKTKQSDRKSRYLRITTTVDGKVVRWNNSMHCAYLRVMRPDNAAALGIATIDEEGKIICELKESMLEVEGLCSVDLAITDKTDLNLDTDLNANYYPKDDSAIITTMNFNISVIKGPVTGKLAAKTEEKMLNDFLIDVSKRFNTVLDAMGTDEQNAYTYSEQARNSAITASDAASAASGSATGASRSAEAASKSAGDANNYYKASRSYATGDSNSRTGEATDNAKYYSQQSSAQATAALNNQKNAEAWAVGQKGGVDVNSSDATYQNNAKYYALSCISSRDAAANSKTAAETAQSKAEQAQSAAESAKTDLETARDLAKSYANGTGGRTGEATDNAKYYSQQAASSASAASTSASTALTKAGEASTSATNAHTSETNAATSATNAATSESNASDSATTASTKATDASTSATQAKGFSKDSEAWAVGKRGGVDVESTDDTYENNSKYWAEQAEQYSYNAQQTAVVSADGTTIEADENGVLSVHPDVLSKDVVTTTETDLDLMKTSGKYYLSENLTNGYPSDHIGAAAVRHAFLQVDVEPSSLNEEPLVTQTLTLTNTSAYPMMTNRVFTRVWFSETVGWSSWQELSNYGEFYKSMVENSEEVDFDNFVTPGAYPKVITYNVPHSPGWACHLNVYYYNDYIEQVAIRHANVGMAMRARINGEWTAWNYVTMTTTTT